MRAREPDGEGYVDLDGVKLHCEVFGSRCLPEPHSTKQHEDNVGGSLVVLGGAGHLPHARDPVKVNLLIRELAAFLPARGAP